MAAFLIEGTLLSPVTPLQASTSAPMMEAAGPHGGEFKILRRENSRPDSDKLRRKIRMKKITMTLLALAYATRLFAQAADPSPTDQGKTGTQPRQKSIQERFWDRLDLTDAQKEKLKQIREADRDSLRSARAQVKIARESLKAALLANPENTADIQAKATNLANALSTSSVQMALHRAKINQVLTPVQRVALDEAREYRMRRWNRRGSDAERGPWEERRPWQRQNQSPQQPPAAPQDSQNTATPTS